MTDHSWLWLNEDLADVRVRLVRRRAPAEAAVTEPQHAAEESSVLNSCQATRSANGTQGQVADVAGTAHDNPASATEVRVELPAHAIVLASASGYWKARLLRWRTSADTTPPAEVASGAADGSDLCTAANTEQGAGNKRCAEMAVSEASGSSTAAKAMPDVILEHVDTPDGMEAARCTLQYAYTHTFPEKVTLPLLLQIAVCADRWDMNQAVAACLSQIKPLTVNDINALLDDGLPAGIKAHCSFQGLINSCSAALMEMFGNAHVVAATPGSLETFLGLSINTLQLWAQQDTLTVDSENTVAVLFQHWWSANSSSLDGSQMNTVSILLTETIRAGQLTESFLMCVMDGLPWFKSTPVAMATLRMLHGPRLSKQEEHVRNLMPAGWVKPARAQKAEELATLKWEVTKAQLDELHRDAARGTAMLYSDNSLYSCGYRWFLALWLVDQKAALRFGVGCKSAMPATLTFHSLVTAQFDAVAEKSTGAVTQRIAITKDRSLPTKYARCILDSFLGVTAAAGPRANIYPPDDYWRDGKLHLSIRVRAVE